MAKTGINTGQTADCPVPDCAPDCRLCNAGKRNSENDAKIATRVSVITIIVNITLFAFKLMAGIVSGSAAMISDAVHTLSDLLTTFIVIIGVNLAGQKPDGKHQYGHERFECVTAIILALALALTGLGIGQSGVRSIISGDYEGKIPGLLALIAAVAAVVIKEWMYRYTRNAAKRINSGALMADAWHHRSDGLSSIGVFFGILGARLGFPILDPIASLVICAFIIKVAYDIFVDAVNKMVDKSCDETTQKEIGAAVMTVKGVIAIDAIRTRIFGTKIYVDLEIAADKDLTLTQAHKIAEDVHDEVEEKFPAVKHCMVHVSPFMEE
jgi:cation diffusion facilitator family transporter